MHTKNLKSLLTLAAMTAVMAALIALSSCKGSNNSTETNSADIYVDIAPLSFFVQEIAGDQLKFATLISKGQDPHTFQPTIKQISGISEAKLFISAAVPLGSQIAEKLRDSNDAIETIILPEHFELIEFDDGHDEHEDQHDENDDENEHHEKHTDHDHHEHHKAHGHESMDTHLWMSVKNAMVISDIINENLCRKWPDKKDTFDANTAKLKDRLKKLDTSLSEKLSPLAGKSFYVFHPAFGYFARDYKLHQKAIEFEGKSPSPKKLTELIASAKADGVKIIFTQPQFPKEAAKTIAAQIGGVVITLDPLSGDYIKNMEQLAEQIAAALSENAAIKAAGE